MTTNNPTTPSQPKFREKIIEALDAQGVIKLSDGNGKYTDGKKTADKIIEAHKSQITKLEAEILAEAEEYFEFTVAPHRFAKPIDQSLEKRPLGKAIPVENIKQILKKYKENL